MHFNILSYFLCIHHRFLIISISFRLNYTCAIPLIYVDYIAMRFSHSFFVKLMLISKNVALASLILSPMCSANESIASFTLNEPLVTTQLKILLIRSYPHRQVFCIQQSHLIAVFFVNVVRVLDESSHILHLVLRSKF